MLVKIESFPQGENKQSLKPPPIGLVIQAVTFLGWWVYVTRSIKGWKLDLDPTD